MTVISFATSATFSFCIPFVRKSGQRYWSTDQEVEIWRLVCSVLGDSEIPKIVQNAAYELFVLAWRHGILIRNIRDDTMSMQWELYPEFAKNLGTIVSLYTDEPYYKHLGESQNDEDFYRYNALDSAVTFEAKQAMERRMINKKSFDHYRFNIRCLEPYTYMQLRGVRIDKERLEHHRQKTWEMLLLQQPVINQLYGGVFNVKSAKQRAHFLYDVVKLPKQFNKQTNRTTTDDKTISKLFLLTQNPQLLELLKQIKLRTRFSDIAKITTFEDGRLRSATNIVGTKTGRTSSRETAVSAIVSKPDIVHNKDGTLGIKNKKTVKRLGTNLQNQTKDLRDVFIPDSPAFDFFQDDLEGADSWTVAADLASCGFPRMLEHLHARIKPARVIGLLVQYGEEVFSWDIPTIQQRQKEIKNDWRYLCYKRCTHGTNYGMGSELLQTVLLKDSMDAFVKAFMHDERGNEFIMVDRKTIERYQNLYATMYNIEVREEMIKRQLTDDGFITAACGIQRMFYGVRKYGKLDPKIVREALSFTPQANTTFVANQALVRGYYDPENRTKNGFPIVSFLIMIHDALAGQWPQSWRDWALEKFPTWFETTLIISGVEVTIPAELKYGETWKDC